MMSNRSIKIVLGCLMFGVLLNLVNYFYCFTGHTTHFEAFLVKSGVTSSRTFIDYLFLRPCPRTPEGPGPIKFNATENSTHLHMVGKKQTVFMYGGYNKVVACTPDTSVAVIVPIAASSKIPTALVSHLHVILRKQLLESRMYVVQQYAGKFDPGRLFMAAFFEINKMNEIKSRETQCFVLNEPTFVPVDILNVYRCDLQPKQLVVAIREEDNTLKPFESTLGGAFALSHEQIMTMMSQDSAGFFDSWTYSAMAKRLIAAMYTIEMSSSGVYILDKSFDRSENVSESKLHTEDINLFEKDVNGSQYNVLTHELRRDYSYLKIRLPELHTNYVQTTTDISSVSIGALNNSNTASST